MEKNLCECPIVYTNEVLKSRWSLLIIYKIQDSKGLRFNKLKEMLSPITASTLTNHLNKLIEHKIIVKIDNKEYPRIVKYKLTKKGENLQEIVKGFKIWGLKYKDDWNC